MSHKLSQIFKNIAENKPSGELKSLILSRIESIKLARERRKMQLSGFGLVFSGVLTAVAIIFFGENIINSEFWNLASLVFSDGLIVAGYWKEFGISLLETLPIIPIAIILAPIAVLFISLDSYLALFSDKHGRYA